MMWRVLSQLLLQRRVVASAPPHGAHLRSLAAAAQRWRGSSSDSVDGRRSSKDLRASEVKAAERICAVVKAKGDDQWGAELERLKIRLRVRVVSKVIRQLGDADAALCFFQWARLQPSFHHSLQTYHAIIEVMGNAQKFDAQKQVLQDMHSQGLQATTSTFNILLVAFSRANETDKVVETFKQMVQYGEENAFAFKCVLRHLVRNARVLEALPIFRTMLEFRYVPDNFTYSGLLAGLCELGNMDEAFAIFQEMKRRGMSPNPIGYAALGKGFQNMHS